MIIGVSGASGHLGRAIVSELRAREPGHRLIGISRSPQAIQGCSEARLGDYNQPESLARAYAGLDRLVLIPTDETAPGVRRGQHVAAVDAAIAAGVKHILFISAAGTREAQEPSIWAAYYSAEQRLMGKATRWSVLRMNYYIDSFIDEVRMSLPNRALVGLAENRAAFVARDDVAAAAAGILLGEGHGGAIYNATGPRSYSGAERCAAISSAVDQPVGFVMMPEEKLRAVLSGAGLPATIGELIINLQKALAAGGFDIVTGDVEKLTGRLPQSLENALQRAFA